MVKEVPRSLRVWFVVHFVADMLVAVPLFVSPVGFLGLFGVVSVQPALGRLVAAALVGVGGTSLIVKEEGGSVFQALLTLKLLWSGVAVVGLVLSAFRGGPPALWFFAGVFAFFFGVWAYYKRKLA